METFYIEAGKYTPEVLFRPESNVFYIIGNSYPENPLPFYQRVFEWFNSYFVSLEMMNEITIHIELEYFNTATAKQIAKLFRIIENNPAGDRVTIKWCYNSTDTDMLETGERFKRLSKLKFEFCGILIENN